MTPDDTTEHWLPIPGWETRYEVSDLGRVRSVGKLLGQGGHKVFHPCTPQLKRYLAPSPPNWSYYRVVLHAANRKWCVNVHKLVALVFLGPRPADAEINHRDGDKANNRADNLEYVTHRQNAVHHFSRVRQQGYPDALVTAWQRLCASGVSYAVVAEAFDTTPQTVRGAVLRAAHKRDH